MLTKSLKLGLIARTLVSFLCNDDLTPRRQAKYPLNKMESLVWRREVLNMPPEPQKLAKDHYAYSNSMDKCSHFMGVFGVFEANNRTFSK